MANMIKDAAERPESSHGPANEGLDVTVAPDLGFTLAAWAPILLVELLAAAIFLLVSEVNDTTEFFTLHEIVGLMAFAVLASVALTPIATAIARSLPSLAPAPVAAARAVSRLVLGSQLENFLRSKPELDAMRYKRKVDALSSRRKLDPLRSADEMTYRLLLDVSETSTRLAVLRLETRVRQAAESAAGFLVAPLPTLVPTIFLWNRFGWHGAGAPVLTALYCVVAMSLSRRRKWEYEDRHAGAVNSMVLTGRHAVLQALGFRRPENSEEEMRAWDVVLSMLLGDGVRSFDVEYAHAATSQSDDVVSEIGARLDAIAAHVDGGARVPIPVEYRGIASAGFRDAPRTDSNSAEFTVATARTYTVRVAIGGDAIEPVFDTLVSDGRVAPSAFFRIAPDAEMIAFEPSELILEVPRDGTVVYKDFRASIPEEPGRAMVWIRIYQHRRLLQVLQLAAVMGPEISPLDG